MFLVLEIGAGYLETKALSDAFTPHVRALHQELYYNTPRFHISIAWGLLCRTEPKGELCSQGAFPAMTSLPDDVVKALDDQFGSRIREIGLFNVDRVEVKIGKEVTRCPLG